MRKHTGQRFSNEEMLLAAIADRLSILCWQNTADGQKGRNQPRSILETMTADHDEKQKLKGFDSLEEFKRAFTDRTQGD